MDKPNNSDLETFYENLILPRYQLGLENITWTDHGKIGEDVFAHYFTSNDTKYVLVFEDFPSESHFISQESELVPAPNTKNGLLLYPDKDAQPQEFAENVTGYFSLYKA